MPIFLDDGATGGADGTTWADAYTTLAAALADTDLGVTEFEIWVADTHSETIAGATALAFGSSIDSPNRLFSVTPISDVEGTYNAGAAFNLVSVGQVDFDGSFYMRGFTLNLDGSNNLTVNGDSDTLTVFEDCTFDGTTGGAQAHLRVIGSHGICRLINCTMTTDATGGFGVIRPDAGTIRIEIYGGSANNTNASGQVFGYRGSAQWELIGVDLSGGSSSATIFNRYNVGGNARIRMAGCPYTSGQTLINRSGSVDGAGEWFAFAGVTTTSGADPDAYQQVVAHRGSYIFDTARYVAGGFQDPVRTNPVSLQVTAAANETVPRIFGICSDWIQAWTSGDGAQAYTFTLRIAHDSVGGGTSGRLTDEECWLELFTPNSATNNSLLESATTKPDPLVAATDLTDDTDGAADWTEDFSSPRYQLLQITATPDKAGQVLARLCFAPGGISDTVINFDPKLLIAEV